MQKLIDLAIAGAVAMVCWKLWQEWKIWRAETRLQERLNQRTDLFGEELAA